MMRCVSKGSVGDAKRLRETASRLRAMMKVKDELLARQEELVGLQAEQLAGCAKLIDAQAEQIGVLEELVARYGGRAGQGAALDECDGSGCREGGQRDRG
jgi:septal ring factor EnvC (AmiA/AmiB activator)